MPRKGGSRPATDLPTKEIRQMWEGATKGAINDPFSVEDVRGKVLEPETDRRMTPHDRTLRVMERDGIEYKEAMEKVLAAMRDQDEIK